MESNSFNYLEFGFWFGSITIFTISIVSNYTVEIVPSALLQFIRYGRLNFTKIKTNSIFTSVEVPKRWFTHFYFFAVMCQSVVCYVVLNVYCLSGNDDGAKLVVTGALNMLGGISRTRNVTATTTAVATLMYFLHVLRRLYESNFVSVYSDTRMNFFVYIMSYGYYLFAILSLIAHSPAFCSQLVEDYTISWKHWTTFNSIGLAIFLHGFIEQYRAHVGFANLRNKNGSASTEQHKIVSFKHHIPKGGLFELISSPNYWAEILIYIGLAFVFGFKNRTWNAVTIWVITSQILAGIMNHKWYLATFPEYPRERKAIIPHIL